jgi:hypothetical protein
MEELAALKARVDDAGGEMDTPGGGKFRLVGGKLLHYDADALAEERSAIAAADLADTKNKDASDAKAQFADITDKYTAAKNDQDSTERVKQFGSQLGSIPQPDPNDTGEGSTSLLTGKTTWNLGGGKDDTIETDTLDPEQTADTIKGLGEASDKLAATPKSRLGILNSLGGDVAAASNPEVRTFATNLGGQDATDSFAQRKMALMAEENDPVARRRIAAANTEKDLSDVGNDEYALGGKKEVKGLEIQGRKDAVAAKGGSGGPSMKFDDVDKAQAAALKTELTGKGTIAINSKKIDAAKAVRTTMNKYYNTKTGRYEITSSGYGELTTTLNSLLAVGGTGQGSDTMRRELKQATGFGDVMHLISYLSGNPQAASTQAVFNQLAGQIDAVGLQDEATRDEYITKNKKIYADIRIQRGMKPEEAIARSEAMAQSAGGSYKEFLKREHQALGFPMDKRGLDAISDTPPVKGGGATAAIRLSGDKAKRLAELRKKQAEGTLK